MVAIDAAARERALDPTQSFIVSAPAGSGKTELLIQRYLRLLARVDKPESVVAITFTRKAESEMRSRVVMALRRALTEPRPEKAHEAITWDLASAVIKSNQRLGWDLLRSPLRLRIQTIDALCAAITRQMPLLSGFGEQPNVEECPEELYREAARQTILFAASRCPEDQQALEMLLMLLDNNITELENLLVAMLQRREQWLRHMLLESPRDAVERGLRSVIRDILERVRYALPKDLDDELIAVARAAARHMEREGREGRLLACRDLTNFPRCVPEDVPAWCGIAELLLTQRGDWRSSFDVRCGFPPQQERLKQRARALVAQLRGDEELRTALRDIRHLPPPRFDDTQWRTLEALFRLLPVAVARLKLVFRDRGTVDFSEVSQRALTALGAPEHPTDLALALDCRIEHLLVDEFQDTSLSQFELIEKLTAGWQPGDGRTLFLVGDPMQSIYRFREAEVGLFLRARNSGIGSVQLEPLRLSLNFRSEQAVVDWVNASFERIFPERDDIASGAIAYRPSEAASAEKAGAIAIHPFLSKDDRGEAELVSSLVLQARAADPAGTIAILVRARAHLPHILRSLQQAGLGYRAIEIDPLEQRPAVQDLVALTRALLHPADRVSWLAILRAPWCGLTLADLHAIAGGAPDQTIWQLLGDPERLAALSADGLARVCRVRAVFEACFARTRRVSLRRWVEGAWIALGGPACLDNAPDWDDAQAYLDLLERIEEGGELSDFGRLAREVTRLFAAPDSGVEGTLEVMTIHKAKGLEFDTVIVPGLGRNLPSDDTGLLTWLEAPDSRGESQLLLAPMADVSGNPDPITRYIRRRDREKADYESARLLYVAATRARKSLHLIGHVNLKQEDGVCTLGKPDSDTLLCRLWPAVQHVFVERLNRASAEPAGKDPATLSPLLRRLPAGWTLPAPPDPAPWRGGAASPAASASEPDIPFLWVGDTLRHIGTVVHRMLRRIAEEGLTRWDKKAIAGQRSLYRAALATLGVAAGELDAAVATVERALVGTLNHERGRWILHNHGEDRCEYAVTGSVGGSLVRGIIDRTFIDSAGARWIIDFKTGTHEGAGREAFLDAELERYRDQLERYAALFSRLENRPIRLGLYFPLLGGWREWRPAPMEVSR